MTDQENDTTVETAATTARTRVLEAIDNDRALLIGGN
jgi:hypothetical protein